MVAPTAHVLEPTVARWLVDPAHPTVRRLARARLGLDDDAHGTDLPIAHEPWVRALVSEPGHPERHGEPLHPYQKWAGVHWRLAWLAELDVAGGDPSIAPVVDEGFRRVVGWLEGPGRIDRARPVAGRVRMCASMDGLAGWAAVRNGLAAQPGVRRIAERLVSWQWPDGGWNCDKHREASHASFNESWGPLRMLSAYAGDALADPALARDARLAADRAAEFLLVHEVVCSHRTGELAHPMLDGQRWPPYWHYDRLTGLRVLAEAGRLADPRTARAIDDLRARASADGRWRPDRRFWRAPGATGSGVEAVDWTTEGSSKLITLQALEVLGEATRG